MIAMQANWQDYPDKDSLAITLYLKGCIHNCKGCHNKSNMDITLGNNIPLLLEKLPSIMERNKTDKLVLSGGDPLYNYDDTRLILQLAEKMNWCVCIYTGYDYKEAIERIGDNFYTYLKCGTYQRDKAQPSYKSMKVFQLASTNQELYDFSGNLLSVNGSYYFKE